MPRAATTSDVFNAVAEPVRRDVLDLLAQGELPVNDIVGALGLAQPRVSRHLKVLRSVDLVRATTLGRQRLYRLNGPALQPIHTWVGGFERYWTERFDRLDDLLIELQKESGT
jgi:DNA-binding transcriptional ArsR family regulator